MHMSAWPRTWQVAIVPLRELPARIGVIVSVTGPANGPDAASLPSDRLNVRAPADRAGANHALPVRFGLEQAIDWPFTLHSPGAHVCV